MSFGTDEQSILKFSYLHCSKYCIAFNTNPWKFRLVKLGNQIPLELDAWIEIK